MPHDLTAAMLFAAGFGTRMGALTQDRPKPLIPVAGKALLDHALEVLEGAGIRKIVVNTHYRGAQIAEHLAHRPDLHLVHEELILETGGGLRNALPILGHAPVITLNSDAVWTGKNPVRQLLNAWDVDRMDALLLLLPAAQALGHAGRGDFVMDAQGRLTRAAGAAGLIYLGAQILRTEGLAQISDPVFSLNRLWDQAIAKGRAYGIVHHGQWCDVGHPEGIATAERLLTTAGGWTDA